LLRFARDDILGRDDSLVILTGTLVPLFPR
jgi:hypothetical protein